MRKLFLLLLLSTITKFTAQAQYKGLGSWNIITVNLPGNDLHHWGGYAEAQNRNYDVTSHFYYYEVKAGVSYNLDKNSYVLLGTGRYTTYGYDAVDDGPQITETRLWEQLTYNHYISRVKLEHRYRIEQRFLNTGYLNRFRYRLNVTVPINKPVLSPTTFFAAAFGEVFFNNKQPNLERNRFSPSLGYQFNKAFLLQAGYINQRNYATLSSNDKNYLILTATYNIQRK
ncbi:DUF2490 domain-containing protein [Mucilaginibacter robiniae]|uniref:DUF2490 domain-containing protein n=1 Tax=Mucilaginibacter robiniae TaxID=2728022 RepID=A0A7L5DXJ5_9SPHI|nr:DUF2490 domain-containing protein [Mucilaginibacter robiniae]QJD94948.1 DUF2490 domain-containing protein [Mucilaginibacter robiniae]